MWDAAIVERAAQAQCKEYQMLLLPWVNIFVVVDMMD
jgi:hypothetical protein